MLSFLGESVFSFYIIMTMSTAFPVKLPRLLCFLFGFFFLPGITNCFDYCCLLRLLHEYSHLILKLLLTFSFFFTPSLVSPLKKISFSICLLLTYPQILLCVIKNV